MHSATFKLLPKIINNKYNNDLCKTCKLISSLKYIRIMMIHAINSKTKTRGNYENKNYM